MNMPKISLKSRREHGSALLIVLIVGGIIFVTTAYMLILSSSSIKNSYGRVDWNKAFFAAENAAVWAAQKTFDISPAAGSSNIYSVASGTLPVTAIVYSTNSDPTFKGAWVKVQQPSNSPANVFLITSSARVNNKIRTVQTQVTIRPVSQVFDYEYFLNNWGWWWGNTITGNGDQRSNWDFDFKYNPVVNGAIYAAGEVDDNGTPIQNFSTPPFGGLAGADTTNLVHQGAQRVTMPNLLNFSNYIATALVNTASNGMWLGSTQIVFGVQSNVSKPGLYIVGTPAAPIRIKGTVVVPGDVVIKGTVTGQGTLYVGGNLYIANDITYSNGPDYSAPPETMATTNRNSWVQNNQNKDLVAYAVRGSILAGDVTAADWINYCMNYPGSGLKFVGDESQLGQDGIAGTGDDNIPFLHPDGTTSTWYDADGDGLVNGNFNYSTDINMDNARASKIFGYPITGSSNLVDYSTVATSNMGTLEGVFYTNHAAAMRLANANARINGGIISRNEQIIFQNYLTMVYDSRVHSRYSNNPNQIINLGLPWGKPIAVNTFVELTPDATSL
jgi:hypothetical protein